MRGLLVSMLCLAFILPGCRSRDLPPPHPMDARLAALLPDDHPGEFAIAYRDLASGHTFLWHAQEEMHAASTMKIPVMIAAFREAEARGGDLSRPILVKDRFESILDGSSFTMPPDEDSERSLYERVGSAVPARELVRLMITWSSNLATNVLVDAVGVARIQAVCAELGAEGCRVLRGVQDLKAYRAGISNTTTALALLRLLQAIHEDRAAGPAACRAMREILGEQQLSEMVSKALPEEVRVLSKTGRITGHDHEAALVHPVDAPPYVLVILTRGFPSSEESVAAGQEITRTFHAWHGARAR